MTAYGTCSVCQARHALLAVSGRVRNHTRPMPSSPGGREICPGTLQPPAKADKP